MPEEALAFHHLPEREFESEYIVGTWHALNAPRTLDVGGSTTKIRKAKVMDG